MAAKLPEGFAKGIRDLKHLQRSGDTGSFQKHLGLDCTLERTARERREGRRGKAKGRTPMEVARKAVIASRKWGTERGGELLSSAYNMLRLRCIRHTWIQLATRLGKIIQPILIWGFPCTSTGQEHNDQADAVPALLKHGREKKQSPYQSDGV